MKTIFITSFEGVETKNLLRTTILPTLQQSERVRIILFVHDEERVIYHKKEFADERIIYEVVPKPHIRGLDKLFQKFKFMLLKTETTDIRRRMKYDLGGSFLSYAAGMVANRMLAHKPVQIFFRFLDYHFIKNNDYNIYFEQYHPSLVVLANLFDEPEVHLLQAAKKRRVHAVGFINSWDKVTARCILRLLPDKIIVFNQTVKDEVVRYNHANPDDIFIGGMPQFDHYFMRKPVAREEFLTRMGFAPDTRFLLYAPVGTAFRTSDWAVIDCLHGLLEKGVFGPHVEMLVRFCPNDFVDSEEIRTRLWLRYDHPGFRFSEMRGTDWDMDFKDLAHLGDTLAHMSLLVGFVSSIAIDAAVFDKPIVSINFEIQDNPPIRSPMRYQRMVHCQTLKRTGGLHFVYNKEELITWIRRYLENPGIDRKERARLVREQCVYTDGKSGERIGQYILDLLQCTEQ